MTSLINKQVNVLDKGWIELQDIMGNDLAIINAARVSFLGESKGDEADKKLLFYLMKHKHTTPFEMVEFKFQIHAPLIIWWQWVRHRTFSFNAQSGRYTAFEENDFYVPEIWRKQSKSNKQGGGENMLNIHQELLTPRLRDHYQASYNLYLDALNLGVAKEQARLFLPGFAMYYTWIVKVDARNLMRFLKLRMADDAQWEIRQYAKAIYQEFFKPLLPWTSEAFEIFVLQNNTIGE